MQYNITTKELAHLISESIKTVLNEKWTNMRQLYHKTSLDRFVNILKTNTFYLFKTNHNGRGGKYYASLTRYHGKNEGYDVLDRQNDAGELMGASVTITFNIQKLSHIHGIEIRPFDFYGTHDKDREGDIYKDNGVSSKMIYQKQMSKFSFGYDEPEYYNMAEENIVSDTVKKIPDIIEYIDKVEVYFPSDKVYDDESYDDMDIYDRTLRYAYAFYKLASGTPWENKIIIYFFDDFINQNERNGMTLKQFRHWYRNISQYKYMKNKGKRILDRKPIKRHDINTSYM